MTIVQKLVLYYVEQETGDMEKMIACCRARFGERPVLVPVAVPHFYFDGLLLEVDAFAGDMNGRFFETSSGRSSVQLCDGGELSWVCLKTHPNEVKQAKKLLEDVLAKFGIPADQRICEHWVAPAQNHNAGELLATAKKLCTHDLTSDEGAVVESTDRDAPLIGELTYLSCADSPTEMVISDVDGIRIVKRKSGRFYWFSIRSTEADCSVVLQTRNMMNRLAKALHEEGLDFTAVVKSTSYYTGGNSDSELYANMAIRNSRYSIPGPASTGLPVSNFASNESLIVVDVIAMNAALDDDAK